MRLVLLTRCGWSRTTQPRSAKFKSGSWSTIDSGFWGLIAAAQTPGAPTLSITYAGSQAIVSWPASVTGWALQTNQNLATGTWGNYAGPVNNNSVTNAPPSGNLFFG